MLIVNRLQTLTEYKMDPMVERSLFDEYGRMNNEQCLEIVEALRLLHEYRYYHRQRLAAPHISSS